MTAGWGRCADCRREKLAAYLRLDRCEPCMRAWLRATWRFHEPVQALLDLLDERDAELDAAIAGGERQARDAWDHGHDAGLLTGTREVR